MPRWTRSKENPDLWIKAGWDQELHTFYAVIWDRLRLDYTPVCWVGKTRGEIVTTAELTERLQPKYTLSESLLNRLDQDYLQNPPGQWSFPIPKIMLERWDEWLARRQLQIHSAGMYPEEQDQKSEVERKVDPQQERRQSIHRSR